MSNGHRMGQCRLVSHLQTDFLVVISYHFHAQKVSANGCLVVVAELLDNVSKSTTVRDHAVSRLNQIRYA